MYITNRKTQARHELTPYDIYFQALEEAYGLLPVPSDDYADIRNLLIEARQTKYAESKKESSEEVNHHMTILEDAIEDIRVHYEAVAVALNQKTRY